MSKEKDSTPPSRHRQGLKAMIPAALIALLGLAYALITPATDSSTTGTVLNAEGWRKCSISIGYTVDGARYVLDQPTLRRTNCSKAPGDPITVYYSATEPIQSTTRPGARTFGYAVTGLGTLTLLIQGWFLVRRKRKETATDEH